MLKVIKRNDENLEIRISDSHIIVLSHDDAKNLANAIKYFFKPYEVGDSVTVSITWGRDVMELRGIVTNVKKSPDNDGYVYTVYIPSLKEDRKVHSDYIL